MNRYEILTGKEPPPQKEPLQKRGPCPACKDDGYPCEQCGGGAYKSSKKSGPTQNRAGFYSLYTFTSQRESRRVGTIRSISVSGPSSIDTGIETRVQMTVELDMGGNFWGDVRFGREPSSQYLTIYEDEKPQRVMFVQSISERSEDLLLDIEGYIVFGDPNEIRSRIDETERYHSSGYGDPPDNLGPGRGGFNDRVITFFSE